MIVCKHCNMEIMASIYDKCQLCGNTLEEIEDEEIEK